MTSRASQCDVTLFQKLSLTNSNHIVLASFGVPYDSRFVLDVLDKKFTKLLTALSETRIRLRRYAANDKIFKLFFLLGFNNI